MSLTYKINLDFVPSGIPPVIHVGQFDDDFTIVFSAYASSGTLVVANGTTAEIRGTKRNGTSYSAAATVNASVTPATITVTGSQQMTEIAGKNIFEIVLTKSGKVLSSTNFILLVEPAAMGGTRYSISYSLEHIDSSNTSNSILEGGTFSSTLSAQTGYKIKTVTVTMGGYEVIGAYNSTTKTITVQSVSGDISVTATSVAAIPYNVVTWVETAYGIGDNNVANYQGWAPGCARYDKTLGKVIFLQCHRAGHTGAYSNSQLWAVDPYDIMHGATLLHEFAPSNNLVPLQFDIYNGDYYVVSKSYVWKSTDHGANWTQSAVVTPPGHGYGLQIIDGVMYSGDDQMNESSNGVYYTSDDYGLNWVSHVFDFADDYPSALECSEANFLKFNDRIYANLRRENTSGILAVLDNGTWKVISEQMPNVSSDTYLFATDDDLMCFAAIDRPNVTLKLGTVEIGTNDSVTVTTDKTFVVCSKSGDFHTPTYVVGPDFNMITFMCGGLDSEYSASNNYALVGYTDLSLNGNISYTITKASGQNSDVSETPYAGTSAYSNGSLVGFTSGSIYNFTDKYPMTFPLDSSNNVVAYKPNPKYNSQLATSSVYGYCMYDAFSDNGNYYACLIKGFNTQAAWAGLKMITKSTKTIIANADSAGGITPSSGVFAHAFYARSNLTGNFAMFTAYKITASKA